MKKDTEHSTDPFRRQAITDEMKEVAPQTKGEKHYDRTVALGLFLGIYAASVTGAVALRKWPKGMEAFDKYVKRPMHKHVTSKVFGEAGLFKGISRDTEKLFEGSEALGKQVEDLGMHSPIARATKKNMKAIDILDELEKVGGFKKETLKKLSDTLHGEGAAKLVEEIMKPFNSSPEAQKAMEELAELLGKRSTLTGPETAHMEALFEQVSAELEKGLRTVQSSLKGGRELAPDVQESLKALIKESKLNSKSEDISEILALALGGTVPALPFKWFDDTYQKSTIQNYNKKHGTGIDDPDLSAAAEQRIQEAATQSWTSSLLSRVAAVGVVVATAYAGKLGSTIIETQKAGGKMLMDTSVGKGLMKGVDKMGFEWFQSANPKNRQFIGEMVVADGTWTVYSTALMVAFSKAFAAVLGNKKETAHKPEPVDQFERQPVETHKPKKPKHHEPKQPEPEKGQPGMVVSSVDQAELVGKIDELSPQLG